MSPGTGFKKLFEPGKIGPLALKNRIVMPPMGTRFCGPWGEVTDTLIEWYARRARGGAGLIIVEATHTATALEPVRYTTRLLRADDDSFFPGLFQLAEAVHDAGAKVGIQLSVGWGIRAASGPWTPLGVEYLQEDKLIAASVVPSPSGKAVRELTAEEIGKMVELIGHAAARVKQVGFDAIEINAHSGYLVAGFMSPHFNRRTDQYGGSLDNRLRFLLEIIDSIRKNVGPEFPIIVKYAIDEDIKGGRDVAESQMIARRLQQKGVNAISVSVGTVGSKLAVIGPMYFPEGFMVPLAEALKKAVTIPVILSGRMGNPVLAEQVLEEGKADFIGLGRPLIADPDWTEKVATGRAKEVRWCIACNDCSKVTINHKGPVRCTVNATAGREREYDVIRPAERVKKIAVIGAGPAGMEAARVAALRGHRVTLYEKASDLGGGQLRFAGMPPHKDVLRHIVDYYGEAFKQLANLEVRLGKKVTARDILSEKPDTVIIATGAEPLVPDVPGVDKAIMATPFSLLDGKVEAGKTVVVVGGGLVGCEIANLLAGQGKQVTITEMLDTIAADVEARVWIALKDELSQSGVRLLTGLKLDAITDEGAVLIDRKGDRVTLKADTVVLACGMTPVNALVKGLGGKVGELHVIGDASQPRTIRHAISEGYTLAYRL